MWVWYEYLSDLFVTCTDLVYFNRTKKWEFHLIQVKMGSSPWRKDDQDDFRKWVVSNEKESLCERIRKQFHPGSQTQTIFMYLVISRPISDEMVKELFNLEVKVLRANRREIPWPTRLKKYCEENNITLP